MNLNKALEGLSNKPSSEKAPKKKKRKVVDLGKKGKFVVKRPGALTRKAKKAGKSNHEFAVEHQHDKGLTGEQSRSALGFEAMKRKKEY